MPKPLSSPATPPEDAGEPERLRGGGFQQSAELLRLIFENTREYAIFSMDAERRVTGWNTGAKRILGFTEEEILGQPGDVIFTPEDRADGVPDREARAALQEGRADDERWHQRKDGSRFWASGVMTAMDDDRGRRIGLLKILRDRTEERKAFEELREAKERAEAAAGAKDHFLAVLSHELRTPLNPVLMETGALLEEPGHSEEMREYLEMVSRNITLETRMIDDLLDMTRVAHGKLEIRREPLCVHEALRRALEVSRPELRQKSHRTVLSLEASEHCLEGDFTRLQQAFWNLVKNACKFTPAGGEIRIFTRNRAGILEVGVSDTGIGLEAEALERVFEPFVQEESSLTNNRGGLGLGLSICRAVVSAHGGTLVAESAGAGAGATFRITLPLSGPPPVF